MASRMFLFVHLKCPMNEAAHTLAKSCGSVLSSDVFIRLRIVSDEHFVLMLFD
jgi:hypothetical protein